MIDDVLALAEADSETKTSDLENMREAGLSRLSQLIIDLRSKYEELDRLESRAAEKKREIQDLEQNQAPTLMGDLKMSSFELDDGTKVKRKSDFAISVKEENRDAAYSWLKDHGHEGIVKVEVSVQFGKGEFRAAQAFAERIQPFTNNSVSVTEGVHHTTLKAWARELKEDHRLPPAEKIPEAPDGPFTVFDYQTIEVNVPGHGKLGRKKRTSGD